MPNPDKVKRQARGLWWKMGILVLIAAGGAYWFLRPAAKANHGSTFTARRGDLPIIVVENGSIEAQESQEVRSEVKGWQGLKILSIVEEGYQVSEDDVKTNKVLVELDSSEIRKNLTTSEIDYQGKEAALTEARQAYEIQLAQNKSDIKSAEQKARFARLDVEKYLGDRATTEITETLGLDEQFAQLSSLNGLEPPPDPAAPAGTNQVAATTNAASSGTVSVGAVAPGSPGTVISVPSTNAPAASGSGGNGGRDVKSDSAPASMAATPAPASKAIVIDYSRYASVDLLGDGEAQQKLREAKDGALLAEKEKGSSRVKLDGTERLFQREFVTKTEVDTARLEYEQVDLKVKKSATALNLFMKYEFPKVAEELVSKYEEALRLLERTRKEAVSKLAQARAKLKSAEQQFRIVQEQRKELMDQLSKCTILAKKTGLVIYGGTGDGMYWYGEERIREGALIRERQPIITIPNMSKMAIKVKIHESHIKKVKKGMKARIRVDAQADRQLAGEVTKVGVLPDSQNRWLNPDLKVYSVTVNIDGTHDWLKPGMSAKVEVLVNELKNVVHVPIQAIFPTGKDQVCHFIKNGVSEQRVVETGEYSDEFIEVKKGLNAGDVVMLRAPSVRKQAGAEKEKGEGKTDKESKPEQKAPQPAPAPAGPAAKSAPRV